MDKEMRRARKEGKRAILRAFGRGVVNADNIEIDGFTIMRHTETYADRVVRYRLREILHRTTIYYATDYPFVYIVKSSFDDSELLMLDAVIILKKTSLRKNAHAE